MKWLREFLFGKPPLYQVKEGRRYKRRDKTAPQRAAVVLCVDGNRVHYAFEYGGKLDWMRFWHFDRTFTEAYEEAA